MGSSSDFNNDDAVDPLAICSDIAHEVGHAVGIDHYLHGDLRHPQDSVMVIGFVDRYTVPSSYDDEDRRWLRLHD